MCEGGSKPPVQHFGAGGVPKKKPVQGRAGGSDEPVQRIAQEALEIWSKTKPRAGGSQKVRPTLAQPPFAYLARQSIWYGALGATKHTKILYKSKGPGRRF